MTQLYLARGEEERRLFVCLFVGGWVDGGMVDRCLWEGCGCGWGVRGLVAAWVGVGKSNVGGTRHEHEARQNIKSKKDDIKGTQKHKASTLLTP